MGKLELISKPGMAVEEELCPACNSGDITNDYATGEVYCLKCGLVIV